MLSICLILIVGILYCSAYDNLSRRKYTNQHRHWTCVPSSCQQYASHNAIDENTNTCTRTDTIMAYAGSYTWWYVDFGEVKSISYIRIKFKSYSGHEIRQRGRFAGFSLYLSNTTDKEDGYRCYIDGPELPPLDFNTTCIGHARYVIYYNERLPEGQYLEGYADGYPEGFQLSSITELCDVDVQGCNESGMYGPNCSIECPENCQENRCHILYGTCLGCKPGWGGDLCENVCPFGKYGLECKQACAGHCGGNANCDRVTGHCIGGCASGWTGTLCDKECLNGSYSENCMFNCSGQCLLQEPCDKISGKCVNGCRSGYTNEKCDQECVSQTFGKECRKYCSGHCINNVKCNHITGLCDNGCADGYTGLLCDSVCPSGQFGKNCSGFCSQKCISACHHVDGSCDCTPGWKGIPNCDEECLSGYFGVNCDHQCSRHCVSNDTCNKVNGSCPRGCHKNYVGETCQCKALESDVTGQQTDLTGGMIIGLILSIALNIIFLFVVLLPQIRSLILKRKSHNGSKAILDSETYQTVKEANQQYQDLETTNQSSNYQELRAMDNKYIYQN